MSLEEAIEDLTREIRNLGEHLRREERLVAFKDTVEGQGTTPAEQAPTETETVPIADIQSDTEHVIALIDLSRELGYPYLHEGDKLVVDNRVLDEWNRRNLPTTLEP